MLYEIVFIEARVKEGIVHIDAAEAGFAFIYAFSIVIFISTFRLLMISSILCYQVFIPRRTLDLKKSVERATEALRREVDKADTRERGKAPTAAAIAKRLGITERAVQGVHDVWHTKLSSLDPGGANDNPYEDVQLAKQMDKINTADLDASGNSSG